MSKKTVLALAAMAVVAGTAHAQSSVTVYGIIDQAVRKTNDGTSALSIFPASVFGASNVWTVAQATSSRLGFRGTEDLGGGLKANFQIEHRFMPDTGGIEPRDTNTAGGSQFWNAQSWVGLASSALGEVRLGRQYVPAFAVSLGADPFGYDYSVAGMASWTRGGNGVTTAYNAVTYTTPNMGGLTGQVMVAAGEGAASGTVTNTTVTGFGRDVGASLVYSAGPLYAGLAWNDVDRPSDKFKNTYWIVNVAYDFGFIRPNLSISQGRNPFAATATGTTVIGDVKTKTYLLGATAPLGNGRIKAAIGRHDAGTGQFFAPLNGASYNSGANTTKFALGYEYIFSKRTLVRADIGTAKTETVANVARSRSTGYEVGIKHTF